MDTYALQCDPGGAAAAPYREAVEARVLTVADLAGRFGKPGATRWAAALMREMRHVKRGEAMFTTEEWLAEWLAAKSVPQQNWPVSNYDPLEEVVCSRVIQLIGELARRGEIRVNAECGPGSGIPMRSAE